MTEDKILNIMKELISGLIIEKDKGDLRHVEILEAIAAMGASYVSPYVATSKGDAYDSDLNRYQERAKEFAVYQSPIYPFTALAEEVGEVSALASKQLRKLGHLIDIDRTKLADELGDVLWNLSAIASDYGIMLADLADDNLRKLDERKHGGTISAVNR